MVEIKTGADTKTSLRINLVGTAPLPGRFANYPLFGRSKCNELNNRSDYQCDSNAIWALRGLVGCAGRLFAVAPMHCTRSSQVSSPPPLLTKRRDA